MTANTRGKLRPGGAAFSIQHSAFSNRFSRGARRGVLLLIVLALLAMFGLFAIGFVVIASQAKRTSLQQQRVEQYYDPFDSLLYQGVLQVIRGSSNPASVLRPHSLLEDEYGNTTAPGAVLAGFTVAGGILTLPILPTSANEAPRRVGCVLTMTDGPCRGMSTRIVGFDSAKNTFQVLAFDGGALPVAGDSYVINGAPFSGTGFGYNPYYYQALPANNPERQIMLTAGIDGTTTQNSPRRYALLPNPVTFQQNPNLQYTDPAGPGGANEDYDAPDYQNMILAGVTISGSTLSVVSPSLHRPELIDYWYNQMVNTPGLIPWPVGMTPPDKWRALLQPWGPDGIPGTPDDRVPAGVASAIIQLKRMFILRPLSDDHPGFNGSNPVSWPNYSDTTAFPDAALPTAAWERNPNGPWDVDTDGDGVPDAVWVDLGFPARPAPNGKMYKPLFAILCLDLDGRLNLNAHGSYRQTFLNYNLPITSSNSFYASLAAVLRANNLNTGYPGLVGNRFAGSSQRPTLPRGQGYGPAGINLVPLFSTSSGPGYATCQQLLKGTVLADGTRVEGRYGESDLLAAGWWPAAGRTSLSAPPAAASYDPLTDPLGYDKFADFPDNYLLAVAPGMPPTSQTSYGSIPDLKGTLAVGLDPRGQPIYELLPDPATPGPMPTTPATPPSPFNFARSNHPYELDLAANRSRGLPNNSPDNPFSVAEIEGFFRPYDRDAARLPTRLALLTPDPAKPLQLSPLQRSLLLGHRYEVTTESWSVPVAKTAYPAWLATALQGQANGLQRLYHPVDLARARILGKDPAQATPQQLAQVDQLIANLLPLEFLAGRKMDLNRPSGNGRDDAGVGVVDPPGEPGEQCYYADAARNVAGTGQFNYGTAATSGLQARQLYARHLYVLAQLLIDKDYYPPWIPPGVQADKDAARARWLAQWAVNVVDFRDRDSIMTPFQYKVNPFTAAGWNIAPTDPVVWGCERPELLITEALAIHARRTEDLADFKRVYPAGNPNGNDDDFDQLLRPLGSLFIEVFNPWSGAEADAGEFAFDRPPVPPQLEPPSPSWRGGVLLNQRNQWGEPVWRILIVNGEGDPDDSTNLPEVRRSIYFTDITALSPLVRKQIDGAEVRFYTTGAMAPIMHNRYAVIGPGDPRFGGTTYVSRPVAEPQPGQPYEMKRIDLTVGMKTVTRQQVVDAFASSQVAVRFNTDNPYDDPASGNLPQVKEPAAVVINGALRSSKGYQPPAPPADPTRAPFVRLSVSEPENGYWGDEANPGSALNPQWVADYYTTGMGDYVYRDTSTNVNAPHDEPLDDAQNAEIMIGPEPGNTIGMHKGFRVVCLQRLANPLDKFNPATNPFRTIDRLPVDLVTYNGWTTVTDAEPEPGMGSEEQLVFRSRERGFRKLTADNRLLWTAEPFDRPTEGDAPYDNCPDAERTLDATKRHRCPRVLIQSLGYLNKPFWPFFTRSQFPEYAGDPDASKAPFPWLNWNNRPFVSEMELMLVPWERSSRLLTVYGLNPTGGDPFKADAIDPAQPNPVVFPHLNNFFFSDPSGTPGAAAANWYRLLEFVGVPSRFVGTETFGNPQLLATPNNPFAPPFNVFSTYREPGRINLNTIPGTAADSPVFRGLLNRPGLDDGGLWAMFNQIKRDGYAPPNPNLPTRIVNPFRGYGGRSLVPLTELQAAIGSNDIDATLLRHAVELPGTQPAKVSLFLAGTTSDLPVNNTNRSPFFRYQELQRLANKVTTQSNVYAVWITVGYFEVSPGTIDTAHPDGYRLGAELGSDTGEVKRHRGFFVIDRSIPVGFQRGKDLNCDKTILLKRYIE